jgi:hypothetical protein
MEVHIGSGTDPPVPYNWEPKLHNREYSSLPHIRFLYIPAEVLCLPPQWLYKIVMQCRSHKPAAFFVDSIKDVSSIVSKIRIRDACFQICSDEKIYKCSWVPKAISRSEDRHLWRILTSMVPKPPLP